MGKKGSKRKTRWRTLSIGAPPGEEDEEDGLRNGYVKGQENDTGTHSFERNGQGGYKPRKTGTGSSSTSGYGSSGARSHKDESAGSPSQPKIIFNEDEYTRITTPRQDVLFKKGYLSRKKPWVGNTSTSATPSTTESQSASHSTADGSETTEDQQLLDRDSGTGEYPPMVESGAQLGYGTFYDHASGYYYEYPVMLVGPAPVPAQVGPSVLAAVPCGPVPLRPIEWINPAFVPKLAGQPYCVMDYQAGQNAENTTLVEGQDSTLLPVENTNGTCNESGTGSASCSGSVAGEVEEQPADTNATVKEEQFEEQPVEEHPAEENPEDEQHEEEQPLENGMDGGGSYLEPVLVQQPVHVSHVLPAVPQPYMYPGHYMFGPPLINVNGVTIQSGPMIRTTDVVAMTVACAKRRKKKKRRKQRRSALGNTEDEEEGEYSSECDTGLPSSRLSWTACPTATTTTTTNRPLNPECQEFHLRTVGAQNSLTVIPTSDETVASEENSTANESSTLSSDAMASVNKGSEVCNGTVSADLNDQSDKLLANSNSFDQMIETPLENSRSTSVKIDDQDNEADRLNNCPTAKTEAPVTNETTKAANGARTEDEAPPIADIKETTNDLSSANDTCERFRNKMNGINAVPKKTCYKETITNGKLDLESFTDDTRTSAVLLTTAVASTPLSPYSDDLSYEKVVCKSSTPKTIAAVRVANTEIHVIQDTFDSLSSTKSSTVLPKRKYSGKGLKFVREPTPGPDLDDNVTNTDVESEKVMVCDITQESGSSSLSNGSYSKPDSSTMIEQAEKSGDQVSNDLMADDACNEQSKDKVSNDEAIEGSNEDSGFESQTRLFDYPITEAVTEWLRRANSPDVFITSAMSSDSETEDEDEMDEKPPKNLQGNPMPALSVNSGADNLALSRTTSSGEFARTSNIKNEQVETSGASAGSRKKRADGKSTKRRSGERIGRRVRRVDGKIEKELVSSSDSCGQREDSVNTARKKNLLKQDVGEVCEFTEKDSVAGMRVALSSRTDSKRVDARRTKRQGKLNRGTMENIDFKIRRIEDVDNEDDEGIVEDTADVRTFEKGEIIVSKDGKLLTTSSYDPITYNASTAVKTVCKTEPANDDTTRQTEDGKTNNGVEEENERGIMSLDSIEEPDVLECWEAETIEPVITPKKMLQSRGILCDGEAAEEDNIADEEVKIDYVQKYYRLARASATSIEREMSESKTNQNSSTSRTVPNNSKQMVESFCSEEVPVILLNEKENDNADDKKIDVDEAFEVYESCYTGKSPFLSIDSKVFKRRTLYGQDGEGPIPCRAVCCNIQ